MKGYKWGIGLEHETHIYHLPNGSLYNEDGEEEIRDHILINTEEISKLLKNNYKKYGVNLKEARFLDRLLNEFFEYTGRKCNDSWVDKRPPSRMPEFVTNKPFANKHFNYYVNQLQREEKKFLRIVDKYKPIKNKLDYYGNIKQFPYGMSNYFKFPTSSLDKLEYNFHKGKKNDKNITDYAGSYHITMTLPFKETTTNEHFIKEHINFANQIQWIEPLLVAGYFSSDDKAVGSVRKRVRGSYRVVRVAWGNFAGSDVRDFKTGVGRYAVIPTKWRSGLDFYDDDKTKICKKLDINTKMGEKLHKKEPQAISSYSSNMRTFGPLGDEERASGAPMIKPNGIEVRIFDNFDINYLLSLCQILGYIAENSRVHQTPKFVYKNRYWNDSVKKVMKEGWKAELNPKFKEILREMLGLKIKTDSNQVQKLLETVVEELWEKNKNGLWSKMLIDDRSKPPTIPTINKNSWSVGFILKMNRNLKLRNNLLRVLYSSPLKMSLPTFRKNFYKHFKEKQWNTNIEDVLYFLEDFDIVQLKIKNDKIKKIILDEDNFIKLYNLNELLEKYLIYKKPQRELLNV